MLDGPRDSKGIHLKNITVVVPCLNEEDNILPLYAAVSLVANKLADQYAIKMTILFVDDGSSDETWSRIKTCSSNRNISISGIKLPWNVGHQQALWEGLANLPIDVDAAIFMDADLQDPPKVIQELVATWLTDSTDLVIGVRTDRKSDSVFKRKTAHFFYKTMGIISKSTRLPKIGSLNAGDFRLLDKSIINVLSGQNKVTNLPPLRFLTMQIALNPTTVSYKRMARLSGVSKYGIKNMFHLAIKSLSTSGMLASRWLQFSTVCSGVFSLAILIYLLLSKIIGHRESTPGWLSVIAIALTSLFVQSFSLLVINHELMLVRNSQIYKRSLASDSKLVEFFISPNSHDRNYSDE